MGVGGNEKGKIPSICAGRKTNKSIISSQRNSLLVGAHILQLRESPLAKDNQSRSEGPNLCLRKPGSEDRACRISLNAEWAVCKEVTTESPMILKNVNRGTHYDAMRRHHHNGCLPVF